MKKLVVEFSEERLITPSGLSLVGSMLGKSDFAKDTVYRFMKMLQINWIRFTTVLSSQIRSL